MNTEYWHRQTETPLFPDTHWSKPERKSQAGNLLIIGGNGLEFAQTQKSYQLALENGAGHCKVILPKTAAKVLGEHPDIEYLPVTNKGSFSLESEQQIMDFFTWADMVLLPGELGRNSETTQAIEHIINAKSTPIVITRESVDILESSAKTILSRENTSLVVSLSQLQQFMKNAEWPTAIRFQMSLPELVEQLHEISLKYPSNFVIYFQQNLVAATNGEVVTTRLHSEPERWRLNVATNSALWLTWIKPIEALATASWNFLESD